MTLLEKAVSAGSRRSPKPNDKDMKELTMAYLAGLVSISQCSRAISGNAKASSAGVSKAYTDLLQTAQAMYRAGELVVPKSGVSRLSQVVG